MSGFVEVCGGGVEVVCVGVGVAEAVDTATAAAIKIATAKIIAGLYPGGIWVGKVSSAVCDRWAKWGSSWNGRLIIWEGQVVVLSE